MSNVVPFHQPDEPSDLKRIGAMKLVISIGTLSLVTVAIGRAEQALALTPNSRMTDDALVQLHMAERELWREIGDQE